MIASVGWGAPTFIGPGPAQFPGFARGLYGTADLLAGPMVGGGMPMPEFSCGMMMPPMMEQQMIMMCMLQASMLGMMSSLLMQQAMAGTNSGCLPMYQLPPGEICPPQPTQLPVPNEWANAAADSLHAAMAREGTDREAVFRLLEEATPAQLRALDAAFEERHGEYWYDQGGHLRGALRSELNDPDFDRALVALMRMHEPDSVGAAGYWEGSGSGESSTQTNTTVFGDVNQTNTGTAGDDVSTQTNTTIFGDVSQTNEGGAGDDISEQTNTTIVGDVAQTNAGDAGNDTSSQTTTTIVGDTTQSDSGGAGDDASEQTNTTVAGNLEQTFEGGSGTDSANQDAVVVAGDVTQQAEAENVNQEADVLAGDITQRAEGENVTQEADVLLGQLNQEAETTGNASQDAGTFGPATQHLEGDDSRNQLEQEGPTFGRADQTSVAGADDDVVVQRAGQGILGFFTDGGNMRTDLGAGNDSLTVEGNSSADAIRVDTGSSATQGPDRDTVNVTANGGDDTVMVRLSRDADRYTIDGGSGTDRLVVHEGQNRVRIVDAQGNLIYQSQGWTEADSVITANRMDQATIYREDGSFASWTQGEGLQERRDPPTTASMTPVQAARIFRDNMDFMDNAAGIGNRDGIVGKPDLQAMLTNPDTPPELRTAIQYSLDNPAVFRSLDAAGAGSNRFDLNALNRYIDEFERTPGFTEGPVDDRRAAEILRYYAPVLDTAQGGGSDRVFSENDLRVFLSENPGAPPELQAAANHLLGSGALQDRMDNASGWYNVFRDDAYSTSDLDAYLGR